MNVLVTGGAGFIGSHVVDLLQEAGNTVAVLDDLSTGNRDNVSSDTALYIADIRDAAAVNSVFSQVRPDVVCHQAAQISVSRSVREPRVDAEVNTLGLINVLDASVRYASERVVFASSGGVLYGNVTAPASERMPAGPVSPYGITKWMGERYLAFYAAEHGLATVALRYANVYGPRQNPHGEAGVVAVFCTKYLAGERARINGDGRYVRDYVHGLDVARANVLALSVGSDVVKPGALTSLNIGTGSGTDVIELERIARAQMAGVLATAGRPVQLPLPEHGPERPGDLRSNLLDATLASHVLGWQPKISLVDGLRSTAAWFASSVK